MKKLLVSILFALAVAVGAACGDDHADPGQAVCNAITAAGTPLAATATRAMAPELAVAETPYAVRLPAQQRAYLKLIATGDTELLLASDTANVIGKLYQGDMAEPALSVVPLAECATAVPAHADLDLATAGTYYLELGPSAKTEIKLMLVSGAGHADE